jgi:hypothetical protein
MFGAVLCFLVLCCKAFMIVVFNCLVYCVFDAVLSVPITACLLSYSLFALCLSFAELFGQVLSIPVLQFTLVWCCDAVPLLYVLHYIL